MDRQEVFDRVATHLLKQNRKSTKEDLSNPGADSRCMYRGVNGLQCAVGCLIPDDKYEERFEGLTPDSDPSSFTIDASRRLACADFKQMLREVLVIENDSDYEFLRCLQRVHDFGDQDSWRRDLARVAELTNLNPAVLG